MDSLMEWSFLSYAILGGLLTSITCGIIGTYVVLRRITYLAGSISHTAFGGVGLSLLLGWPPLLGASLFSVLAATGMGWIRLKLGRGKDDVLIGAMWSLGMAIGVICIFLSPGYATNVMSYLFGNILLISSTDLIIMTVLNGLIIGCVTIYYRSLQTICADEEFAKILNLPVNRLNFLLLGLIALSIVIIIKSVGILLVITLLTLPAASAHLWTTQMKNMMIHASLFASIATLLGLGLSYWANLPSGPFIVFVSLFIYIVTLGIKRPW